jgi:hypothetical protein
MLRRILFALGLFTLPATLVQAEDAKLQFRPAEKGYYAFDTGLFRGRMRLDGTSQGLLSVQYVPTGMELVKRPGLLSYYRVFSTGTRYGHAARDWPVEGRIVEGGALEIRFPSAADRPLEMIGRFRWRTVDTLDLETTVKAVKDLPGMEVFLSSYFVSGFDPLIYLKPGRYAKGRPASLVRPDWSEMVDGDYMMFPRDRESLGLIYDGRWEIAPNPVTWAFTRYLEAPLALRRHAASGLTVVLMSPPADCFAVGTPYYKRPPDGVAGHDSLYSSLFGRDLKAGQTATAHTRLILAKDLSNDGVLQRYAAYLAERGVTPAAKPKMPTR